MAFAPPAGFVGHCFGGRGAGSAGAGLRARESRPLGSAGVERWRRDRGRCARRWRPNIARGPRVVPLAILLAQATVHVPERGPLPTLEYLVHGLDRAPRL